MAPDMASSAVITGSAGLSAIVEGIAVDSSLRVINFLVANNQHSVGIIKKSTKRKEKINMPLETREALLSTASQTESEPVKRAIWATCHFKHAEN